MFGEHGPRLLKAGFWPRPVKYKSKAAAAPAFQEEWSPDQYDVAFLKYRTCGVALLAGSPFPDGSRLGMLDVDRDQVLPVMMALFSQPTVVRVGKKGAVIFVRLMGSLRNSEFYFRGEARQQFGKHTELFAERKFIVIPPSIHPETEQPYRWLGPAIHEVAFDTLPIIEA